MFRPLVERSSRRRRILALDWRGHGESEYAGADFGTVELVDDALAVIDAGGLNEVVPVAQAHAGWLALELRHHLGERLRKLVLLSWIVLDPPPPFLAALAAMQDPERWTEAREALFSLWTEGVEDPKVVRFVYEEMGSYGFDLWSRGSREIAAAYAEAGSPLQALAKVEPPVPTLHLYAQPTDPGYLAAQEAFAAEHPWFTVRRLEARSHFPSIEVPDAVAQAIEEFVHQDPAR